MTITKQQATSLIYEASTKALGGGEGGDDIVTTTKLGVILIAQGIDPYKLGYYKNNKQIMENNRKAGQFLKEWGELLLSEEPKKDGES